MKILLTTDGSEYSEEGARFLAGLPFSPDDEIAVLHAINWVPLVTEWESFYINFKEIQDEIVPRILDSAAHILEPVKAKISTSFREDYPDKAILDALEESGADLVVMGARGIRGLGSFIVGSVAKLVAIKSPKPVLVVKPPRRKSRAALKVLFATDGSVYSAAAGKVLSSIPLPDDTEITILNVLPTVFEDIPERFAMEINDRIKNIVAGTREQELKESERIIERARKELGGKFSTIKTTVKFGDPSILIINEAEAVDADILAVGTSGMRGIKGILGSVARYILNHSQCSVLIGKT